MSMSDPIADMLTRVRNALLREHEAVRIPFSKFKAGIAKVLLQEGFISAYSEESASVGSTLIITLKYEKNGRSVIRELKRVSKPGLRVFKGVNEIDPVLNGQGIYVVSTSKGVVSDAICRQNNVGGEILCSIY